MGTKNLTPEQLQSRVARFDDLVRNEGGFPDSEIEGCRRTLMNVLGYEPPKDEDGRIMSSPVGPKAAASSAIPVSEGLNIGFVECTPGNGVMSHDHDTNETFTVISGQWRFTCNDSDDVSVELGPLDSISVPAGVERRFTNLASNAGDDSPSLLLVAVAGNQPRAFFEDDYLDRASGAGDFTPQVDRRKGLAAEAAV